jgi:hypothetical protein
LGQQFHERRVLVHFDNVPIHNTESVQEYLANVRRRGRRIEHPPYDPDLAPPDFFLFETIKTYLSKYHFDSSVDLSVAFESFVNTLSEDLPEPVFQEFIRG